MRGGSPITEIEAEITAFIDHDIKIGKIYQTEWSSKFDPTQRYLRESQNKITKIVVVFVVTAAAYRCFAISL